MSQLPDLSSRLPLDGFVPVQRDASLSVYASVVVGCAIIWRFVLVSGQVRDYARGRGAAIGVGI